MSEDEGHRRRSPSGDQIVGDHSAELAALVGAPGGVAQLSAYPVNRPMIGHWVEAMGDENPVYVSDAAGESVGLDGTVAPPTMLQAWVMRGLRETVEREVDSARQGEVPSPFDEAMRLLDEEGFTSVVATNCDQTYARLLNVGERLIVSLKIESVSDVKQTSLGKGRFVTTRYEFVALPDKDVLPDVVVEDLMRYSEPVATMTFRILKFRPKDRPDKERSSAAPPEPSERLLRPRPAITQDIGFWFEGARNHKLLIQRCRSCGTLRHPPAPACSTCRSFDWDTVTASGSGELFSFVVVHYPEVPSFDYPLAIGVVELEEGTRLVADLGGVAPSEFHVGMQVEARFVDFDEELTLPVFYPVSKSAKPPRRA